MTGLTTSLGMILTVLVLNQVTTRSAWALTSRPIYLSMQTLNAASALYIVVYGMPGFENGRIAAGLIALVLVFRIVWNHHERSTLLYEDRRQELEAEHARILASIDAEDDDESKAG